MALPTFTMRELLEAGVHFGHHVRRWNPKMEPYLYGERSHIHIMDLSQTVPMLYRALSALRDVAAQGQRILFVGSKRQSSRIIAETAQSCGQYYINHRWLGGMLTNWQTVSRSINRLLELEKEIDEDAHGDMTKKERLSRQRRYQKLERSLGGIKNMGGVPSMLFIIDTNKEATAVREAAKLGIPVVAVIDSNCDPEDITWPIPGNDDARRAIEMYCRLASEAILDGLRQEAIDLEKETPGTAETKLKEAPGTSSPEARGPEGSKKDIPPPDDVGGAGKPSAAALEGGTAADDAGGAKNPVADAASAPAPPVTAPPSTPSSGESAPPSEASAGEAEES